MTPLTPKLPVAVNDTIQYQGVTYVISAVSGPTTSSLNDENVYQITIPTAVIPNFSARRAVIVSINALGQRTWSFSK